jgi:hypothetical protein|tara:strand:+ start:185 stop:565 length:381 start_codon:yes stop_codon:yes gene_type:complete
MQRRKILTVRQKQDARVEWKKFNLRLRHKYLHSSQMNFEDYVDYIQGYYVSDTQTHVVKWTPPKVRDTQHIPSSTSVLNVTTSSKDSWELQKEKLEISKSYPIMPAYNKGPYMVIPVDEVKTAGKK